MDDDDRRWTICPFFTDEGQIVSKCLVTYQLLISNKFILKIKDIHSKRRGLDTLSLDPKRVYIYLYNVNPAAIRLLFFL